MTQDYLHQYLDIEGMPLNLSVNTTGKPTTLQLAIDTDQISMQDGMQELLNDLGARLSSIARLQGIEPQYFNDGTGVNFDIPAATMQQTFDDARNALVQVLQESSAAIYRPEHTDQVDITPNQLAVGIEWNSKTNSPIAQMVFHTEGTTDATGQDYARLLQAKLKEQGFAAKIHTDEADKSVTVQYESTDAHETYMALALMHATAQALDLKPDEPLTGPHISKIPAPHFLKSGGRGSSGDNQTLTNTDEVRMPTRGQIGEAIDTMEEFRPLNQSERKAVAGLLFVDITSAMESGLSVGDAVSHAVSQNHADFPPAMSGILPEELAPLISSELNQIMGRSGRDRR